jgi:hypothetical protein
MRESWQRNVCQRHFFFRIEPIRYRDLSQSLDFAVLNVVLQRFQQVAYGTLAAELANVADAGSWSRTAGGSPSEVRLKSTDDSSRQ